MRERPGTDMQRTLSLTEDIRTEVSKAIDQRMDHVLRANVECTLWDIGWEHGLFIYIVQDEASEYIEHYHF